MHDLRTSLEVLQEGLVFSQNIKRNYEIYLSLYIEQVLVVIVFVLLQVGDVSAEAPLVVEAVSGSVEDLSLLALEGLKLGLKVRFPLVIRH